MPYEYKVKEIIKVVDGDTIDVLIDLGFGLTKKSESSSWYRHMNQEHETSTRSTLD